MSSRRISVTGANRAAARGVEQAVEPAELEHRLAKQCVQARVVPHVGRRRNGTPGNLAPGRNAEAGERPLDDWAKVILAPGRGLISCSPCLRGAQLQLGSHSRIHTLADLDGSLAWSFPPATLAVPPAGNASR